MTRQSIIFPKRWLFFLFQIHTLKENVSKTKYINVYFVIRGNMQLTVFLFCLGKAQNPMLFYFSFLYLLGLENVAKSDRTICPWDVLIYLRQCVIDVFCSTSTERSRKSSSLLLTCCKKYTCKTDLLKCHTSRCSLYLCANAKDRAISAEINYTKIVNFNGFYFFFLVQCDYIY